MNENNKTLARTELRNFYYDDFSDSLMISCKKENEKVKENFVFGDFVISLTGKGKIVGLEIRGISSFLENYEIDTRILENIKNAELKVMVKGEMLYILFKIESIVDSKEVEQKIPLILFLH